MSRAAGTNVDTSLEILEVLINTATAAKDQALEKARSASPFCPRPMQDAGAKKEIVCSDCLDGNLTASLHPKPTPAAQRLLAILESVAAAGKAVDEEMGWLNENGEPIGYYARYAVAYQKLQRDLEGNREQNA